MSKGWQLSLFPDMDPPTTEEVPMVAQMADTAWLSPDGNDINLFAFAKAAHQNAVAHGWYDDQKTGARVERTVAEVLINMMGEVKEFKAKVYAQKIDTYYETVNCAVSTKPEGALIELADLLIRMADAIGYYLSAAPMTNADYSFVEQDTKDWISWLAVNAVWGHPPTEGIWGNGMLLSMWLDEQVGILWEMYRRTSHENFIVGLWEAYVCIFELLNREYPGKIVSAIVLKHEYNKSRPYRHGGLRA